MRLLKDKLDRKLKFNKMLKYFEKLKLKIYILVFLLTTSM